MTNVTREQIEAVARAWASIDGHADDFMRGKTANDVSAFGGRYAGYMEDAEELLKRSGIVEQIEATAYERAACEAEGPLFEKNHRTGEPRYRGTENDHWSVPQPIAGHYGSGYGTGRYDAAKAIRALSPSTARYVELPEGHVVVPAVADQKRIEIIESFIGDYTSRPIHGAARLYSALVEK